jgi:hypothetical protein
MTCWCNHCRTADVGFNAYSPCERALVGNPVPRPLLSRFRAWAGRRSIPIWMGRLGGLFPREESIT